MPPWRDEYEDEELEQDDEEEYDAVDEEDEEEDEFEDRGKVKHKRSRSDFVDDYAEEDDEEEEDDDEEYAGCGGGGTEGGVIGRLLRSSLTRRRLLAATTKRWTRNAKAISLILELIYLTKLMDEFTVAHCFHVRDEQEDVEEIERRIQERYAKSLNVEHDEEATNLEQQALLPSVRDPKLWMVKCAIGGKREGAVCLMQKCIDKGSELQIRSAIALDHLKNYIYIEADRGAHVWEVGPHVWEAIKGMRSIYPSKIMLVPIKEMANILSVESKAIDISTDTWVRVKIGKYKGDLAKVVDVRQCAVESNSEINSED